MKDEKDVQARARRKENKDVWTTSQTPRLGRMATFIYVVRITVLYRGRRWDSETACPFWDLRRELPLKVYCRNLLYPVSIIL
jgi:hypothetical protein